jgi:hypothetical protein
MSITTLSHWATPLHSIPPPSHDTIVSSRLELLQEERECKNQQSKTIEVLTSTSSVSVSIPLVLAYMVSSLVKTISMGKLPLMVRYLSNQRF